MKLVASSRFLAGVLWVDAASAAASGLLQLAATDLLARWLGLPAGLVAATGWILLAVAAWAAIAAGSLARGAVLALVAANLAWVLGCVELLFTGTAGTVPGVAWLAMQAVAVGTLAALEGLGLRRRPAAAWA